MATVKKKAKGAGAKKVSTRGRARHAPLGCEDTIARARSQHNFGLIVDISNRLAGIERVLRSLRELIETIQPDQG